MEHLCRSTGRPELEGQLSVIVSQYRRLLSTCIVRAQAQCLISRIGVISPQAREAAQRREVAGKGGQKGQLDGKHAGARISKRRKMPHVVVICLCQNFDLPLFVALSKFLSIIVNIQ